MKNLKVKSILFSLLAVMAVAVFLTSCEQTIALEDEIIEMNIQDNETIISVEDLPASPEEVWAAANTDSNNSDLNNTEEALDTRSCPLKVRKLRFTDVIWYSTPQYALWIYHYDSNGNFISHDRKDVTYCHRRYETYSPPPGRCKSVAFVGYQSWGTVPVGPCP